MASYLNGNENAQGARPGEAMQRTVNDPLGAAARAGAANAMEFQLWVSQQASSLARLKIFHTMAKSINDQQ